MASSSTHDRPEAFDLLIVTDATSSMGAFLLALSRSLPEIIRISALTDAFQRIGIIAYRDYCDRELLEWSGWCHPSPTFPPPKNVKGSRFFTSPPKKLVSQSELLSFAQRLDAIGGGDYPEAAKTGLAMAHEVMRHEATTIMLLYADAPPHFSTSGGEQRLGEIQALRVKGTYGGFGPQFVDWAVAARTLAAQEGGKKARVYPILSSDENALVAPFAYLATVTGGRCFSLPSGNTKTPISELTIGILLTWMGAPATKSLSTTQYRAARFKTPKNLLKLTTEKDLDGRVVFAPFSTVAMSGEYAMSLKDVTISSLDTVVRARNDAVTDFSKRYVADPAYREFVVAQLRDIISQQVTAMSVNPVFGTLWRTVCNDRENSARDELISLFGLSVERLSSGDSDEKTRMKLWLEASYDYAGEITAMVEAVPEEERFPCVYLDPTQDYGVVGNDSDDEETNKPLNEFTRNELLEIGRSCDFRILRRLGKVLTRLSFVDRAEDLPHHIKCADEKLVPRIPLALSKEGHKFQFWRVLLHVVLSGTMLARRPAALLAALSLRMGIRPLRDAADEELISYREQWNTLEIPETWNLGCLGLLLDADDEHTQRVSEGDGASQHGDGTSPILLKKDRRLFKTLVDYKMLELNMKTTLTARVGWTPVKAKASLGPLVTCRGCNFPRSVTIMGPNGKCGMCSSMTHCQCPVCAEAEDHKERLVNNVSAEDSENTLGTWVECSAKDCRAQYVVYNPAALNVRAKCYYCRHGAKYKPGDAPFVECTQCLNRMIYPHEYRPDKFEAGNWRCSHCTSGVETIVDSEVVVETLASENGTEWLLRNDDKGLQEPFNGRSLFYAASHCDLDNIDKKVHVLPRDDARLTWHGKTIQNSADVIASLRRWVLSRRTEAGQCALCFTTKGKSSLQLACGRRGCHQSICEGCRNGWFGLNAAGQLLNIAALSCPFCRRMPAPSAVARYGLTRLGNARVAVQEAGEWVYAWCGDCGFAKRFVERVCARAVPTDVRGWTCDACRENRERERLRVIEMRLGRLRALEEAARLGVRKTEEMKWIKECPKCRVMTEKMGGCDHISCPCGAHWCYACGKEVSPSVIYTHMSSAHGGLWGGDFED